MNVAATVPIYRTFAVDKKTSTSFTHFINHSRRRQRKQAVSYLTCYNSAAENFIIELNRLNR